jgi:NitT/TauT family transport system permease protein
MNALSDKVNEQAATPEGQEVDLYASKKRRRTIAVNVLRVLLLVVFIGGWQFTTSVGIVDPFFWGQPSGIWNQIVTWVRDGTAQGPLWEQIAVTIGRGCPGFH